MILNLDNEYVVLLDACVLAPMPGCETLLRLASEPALYQVRWSEEILCEVARYLQRKYTAEQVERRLCTMREHFPEAMVDGFQHIAPTFDLPDPKDWHVMAAAIVGGANTLVTANLRHFPAPELQRMGVLVQHPDEFLLQQFNLNPRRVREALIEQASSVKQRSIDTLLRSLAIMNPRFVAAIAPTISVQDSSQAGAS
ncbi:MAG: PIN domain-containing protein [Bryobacterales bacterium]|jgi:predicted nucleic acid-binding protein|nr:PIN domain-containing protein [Bryobacterales bacterium]